MWSPGNYIIIPTYSLQARWADGGRPGDNRRECSGSGQRCFPRQTSPGTRHRHNFRARHPISETIRIRGAQLYGGECSVKEVTYSGSRETLDQTCGDRLRLAARYRCKMLWYKWVLLGMDILTCFSVWA
ncbi:hypothetical protein Bbelb_400000, partial [Branchiostoma belcheri]